MKWLLPVLVVLSVSAAAQIGGGKVYRLGVMAPSAESMDITRATTLTELSKLGFSEGENLAVDERVGVGNALTGLARAMVQAKPDAIFAIGPDAVRCLKLALLGSATCGERGPFTVQEQTQESRMAYVPFASHPASACVEC